MKKLMMALMLGLLGQSGLVYAQAAASSPAKKELVARVLTLQMPAIEGMARVLAEQPAAQMMQQANMVLQNRIAPEKREAMGKEIQADLKKYVDEAVPLVRDRALKLAPSTVGALLEEKFTEDELKQLLAIIESPINKKFQQLGGDMQKALAEKLVPEARGLIEPKIKALDQAIVKRLGIQPPPASAPAAPDKAKAPAKAASK
ncbi:MAG: hypothetical protein IPI20_02595 [Rhodoferax sp.]|nr:hypothetical protein [Rhodoferax sp.]